MSGWLAGGITVKSVAGCFLRFRFLLVIRDYIEIVWRRMYMILLLRDRGNKFMVYGFTLGFLSCNTVYSSVSGIIFIGIPWVWTKFNFLTREMKNVCGMYRRRNFNAQLILLETLLYKIMEVWKRDTIRRLKWKPGWVSTIIWLSFKPVPLFSLKFNINWSLARWNMTFNIIKIWSHGYVQLNIRNHGQVNKHFSELQSRDLILIILKFYVKTQVKISFLIHWSNAKADNSFDTRITDCYQRYHKSLH